MAAKVVFKNDFYEYIKPRNIKEQRDTAASLEKRTGTSARWFWLITALLVLKKSFRSLSAYLIIILIQQGVPCLDLSKCISSFIFTTKSKIIRSPEADLLFLLATSHNGLSLSGSV